MKPFYMARIVLDAALINKEFSRRPALRNRPLDPGYLVHSALRELFGEAAPAPFAVVSEKGRAIEVLGYTNRNTLAVKDGAPSLLREEAKFKQMPESFAAGKRYRFRLRACPVVRQGKPKGGRTERNSEIDAYLAAIERQEDKNKSIQREDVYRKWLERRFSEAVDLGNVRLTLFRLSSFLRRNNRRESRVLLRPEVVFEGKLKVKNPEQFATILRKGLGRHKAFGFGMILLKPVEC